MYLARVAAMQAGVPDTTPAMNVNRLCGSGAQAIVSATQALLLGDADVALAGGAECMSRSPYAMQAVRWGQKMGDTKAVDMMTGALTCPFGTGHMGVTAENVAAQDGVSRADQDAFALESQARAARAIAEGRFADQIVPVEIASRKGPVIFAVDEHPKATTMGALAGLRPAFKKDGTVTAGNASGLNDGAGALVLARESAMKGLKPVPPGYVGGQARRNWRISLQAPNYTLRAGTDASGQLAMQDGFGVLAGLRDLLPVWIVNPMPYMDALENGWSKQAPTGMVANAVAAIIAKYRRVT